MFETASVVNVEIYYTTTRMPKWKVTVTRIVLLMFLGNVYLSAGFDYDYEDPRADSWGRCPWIRNTLKNGRVRVRSRGRIAKFSCKAGFDLVGKKFATCVRGQWNNPIPVCITKGCSKITAIPNGIVTDKYKGAQLTFNCNPGYKLFGDSTLYCDGTQWDKNTPSCQAATTDPSVFCDFEDPDLCGWSHDPSHDFDWRRHQFKTPSGHVGTGPSYDHTFGKGKDGYYIYQEASAPRNENDTSRLFSPVYPRNHSGGCFVFWYHMYGANIGKLRVYVKPESHVFVEVRPSWEKSGNHGNHWLRGNVTVPTLNENFQIVIEGIRGSSHVGDTAIDDVRLLNTDCSSLGAYNTTEEEEEESENSCRGRCHEATNATLCGCTSDCEQRNTCCSDYPRLCTESTEPPTVEDESGTGTPETASTPEVVVSDIVGTPYSGTPPEVTTVYITRSVVSSTATSTQQPSEQERTTTPVSTVPVVSNINMTATTIQSTTASNKQEEPVPTNVTQSVNLTTQSTVSLTEVIITQEVTTSTSVSPAPTMKSSASETTSANTISATSVNTAPVSVKTDTTSRSPVVTDANTTVSVLTEAHTWPSSAKTPEPTTTGSPTTTSTTTTTTIQTTASTVTTTKRSVPPFVTVTGEVNPVNVTPTASPARVNTTNVTFSSTASTSETSMTSTAQSTRTTAVFPYRVRTIPSTTTITPRSVTVKPSSTVSANAKTTKNSYYVISTRPPVPTSRSDYRSTRSTATTKIVSAFYPARTQIPTVSSDKDDNQAAMKSKTDVTQNSGSRVAGISIGVIIVACLVGGVAFVFLRRRRQKLNSLSEDSEIRYLPDSEIIEYSDASVTDPLFES